MTGTRVIRQSTRETEPSAYRIAGKQALDRTRREPA
jgi:hypothetical protein